MSAPLPITSPATVYVRFTGQFSPRYFAVKNISGELYHFRFTDGTHMQMKFNVPDPGQYFFNVNDIEIVKIVPIETPAFYPPLPSAQRDRFKKSYVVLNPDLTDSPAICFSETGRIEVSPFFESLPAVMQKFILLHEEGHFLYVTEEYCDLWALINYARAGYNRSVAYYTMFFILNQSQSNINRLENLFNNIQKMQDNEL